MDNTPVKAKYNLKIDDVDISVITENTPDVVAELSKQVENKIIRIKLSGSEVSTVKAAVLCALDYLDENVKLRQELIRLTKKANDKE